MERIASPCETRSALAKGYGCQPLELCMGCPPVFTLKLSEVRLAKLDLSACICCDCPDEINGVIFGAVEALAGAAGMAIITQEAFVYPQLTLKIDATDAAITAGSRFAVPLSLSSDLGETLTEKFIVKVI